MQEGEMQSYIDYLDKKRLGKNTVHGYWRRTAELITRVIELIIST
jgi:hypothetical protein